MEDLANYPIDLELEPILHKENNYNKTRVSHQINEKFKTRESHQIKKKFSISPSENQKRNRAHSSRIIAVKALKHLENSELCNPTKTNGKDNIIGELFDNEYHGVSLRNHRWAKPIYMLINSRNWNWSIAAATFFSLYLPDVCISSINKEYDNLLLNGVLMTIFVFFFIDIIFNCICRKDYFLSFFFGLDLIGTISMISDVPLLLKLFGVESGLSVAKGSRAGKAAKSAGGAKYTARLLRMIKMTKLTRIGKFFKCARDQTIIDDPDNHDVSKIGSRLSDKISKKIIIGVLAMLIVIPIFEPQAYQTTDLESECKLLENIYDTDPTLFKEIITYKTNDTDSRIIYFQFRDITYLNNQERTQDLRDFERMTEPKDGKPTNDYSCVHSFDIRHIVKLESQLNLVMTSVVVALFALGTLLIFSDSKNMVVKPLSRTIQIITDLARSVFWLSAEKQQWTAEEAQRVEKELIHGILLKIGLIFKSVPKEEDKVPFLDKLLKQTIDKKLELIKSDDDGEVVCIKGTTKFWEDDGNTDDDDEDNNHEEKSKKVFKDRPISGNDIEVHIQKNNEFSDSELKKLMNFQD